MVDLDDLDLRDKGGYVLLIRLKERSEIRIGRLGTLQFDSGYYAYIGSAMGGLRQRISRHLRKEKKLHWHIDYFLEKASLENLIVCQSEENIECNISHEIGRVYRVINRFGSSDCKCPGHLFYSPFMVNDTIPVQLVSAGLNPQFIINDQDNGN